MQRRTGRRIGLGRITFAVQTGAPERLKPPDPAGGTLRRKAKAAVQKAERDAETVDRRCVRCSDDEARDLLEYFDRVAAALELRYERSTSCAQAAELS